MPYRKIIIIGLIVGVFSHIAQGTASFFLWDQFYLKTPELARDLGAMTSIYYLGLNLVVGMALSYLIYLYQFIWAQSFRLIGFRAAILLWAVSSPVYILKRQLILQLSPWLILEVFSDLLIYSIAGVAAGFIYQVAATMTNKEPHYDNVHHAHDSGAGN